MSRCGTSTGPTILDGHVAAGAWTRPALTRISRSRRLLTVHRLLALVPTLALIAATGVLPSLHTHANEGHEHPEHRHGPAAHQHHSAPTVTADVAAHLEACDPGAHVVSVVCTCTAPPRVDTGDALVTLPAAPVFELGTDRTVRRADVRAHGPPALDHAAPRAPPLNAHA